MKPTSSADHVRMGIVCGASTTPEEPIASFLIWQLTCPSSGPAPVFLLRPCCPPDSPRSPCFPRLKPGYLAVWLDDHCRCCIPLASGSKLMTARRPQAVGTSHASVKTVVDYPAQDLRVAVLLSKIRRARVATGWALTVAGPLATILRMVNIRGPCRYL